jgi:putative ABC transport system substrate-binding protein
MRRIVAALAALAVAAAVGLITVAPSAVAQPPGKIPKVGYLFSFTLDEGQHLWEACRLGLRDLGYVEGRTIMLEPRWAEGRHDRLPALVADLVSQKVDIIVAAATPASLAAKAGAGMTPIVIVAVADPTRIGLAATLGRPGGNLTGLSLLTLELSAKRLQLIAEIVRDAPRVAVLINPANSSHAVFLEETMAAATAMRIQIQALKARNPDEIEQAFADTSRERANALIVFDDPVIWSHRKQVVALAQRTRLPVMYGYSEFVSEGGLISYGPHRPDLYRRTATYVDKILKGAAPADLPIERPTRFELFVNVKTAAALGLMIPPSIVASADEVVE